jgi:chromosome segregation ATPase
MTTPVGLTDIASRLADLSRQLDKATTDVDVLDGKAVNARHKFEIAFSREFLAAEGSMDVRKHRSVLATERLKLDAEIAEQVLRACRARIATIKMQIETGRSLSAAVRAEVSLAGSGYAP